MSVEALVDTNVLVYRYDPRFPEKQRTAVDLLRQGSELQTLCLPHQAVVEFVAATTRPQGTLGGRSLLTRHEAYREAEELLSQFVVLYPTEEVLLTAYRGAATYQLSWFDAHLWAYAEVYGVPEIYSEDFQHGRLYGSVRVTNPFQPDTVHEPAAPYGAEITATSGDAQEQSEEARLAALEARGLVVRPLEGSGGKPFQGPAVPARGKPASEMVIEDRLTREAQRTSRSGPR